MVSHILLMVWNLKTRLDRDELKERVPFFREKKGSNLDKKLKWANIFSIVVQF